MNFKQEFEKLKQAGSNKSTWEKGIEHNADPLGHGGWES